MTPAMTKIGVGHLIAFGAILNLAAASLVQDESLVSSPIDGGVGVTGGSGSFIDGDEMSEGGCCVDGSFWSWFPDESATTQSGYGETSGGLADGLVGQFDAYVTISATNYEAVSGDLRRFRPGTTIQFRHEGGIAFFNFEGKVFEADGFAFFYFASTMGLDQTVVFGVTPPTREGVELDLRSLGAHTLLWNVPAVGQVTAFPGEYALEFRMNLGGTLENPYPYFMDESSLFVTRTQTHSPPDQVPCSLGDLAPPFSTLDFADVTVFLTAFSEGRQPADGAPPLGLFDFNDVLAFLTAFGDGCP